MQICAVRAIHSVLILSLHLKYCMENIHLPAKLILGVTVSIYSGLTVLPVNDLYAAQSQTILQVSLSGYGNSKFSKQLPS